MVFKITSIKGRQLAFTLIELTVASGLSVLVLAALMMIFLFSNRSFASLTNYLDLDAKTQATLDNMSREIRQVNQVTAYASTNLTFQDYDGASLQYRYDPLAQTLSRIKGSSTNILLSGCDSLQFSIYQRTPDTNSFEPVSTSYATNTKVVELTWNCYRTSLGSKANTESMQSAKVVIRRK